jgi:hypothetical protein
VKRRKLAVLVIALSVTLVAWWAVRMGMRERDFFRRTRCVSNLHQIHLAKLLYSQAHHATNGTPIASGQLREDLDLGSFRCPNEGTYAINPVGTVPSCSYTGVVWKTRHWPQDGRGKLIPWRHELPPEVEIGTGGTDRPGKNGADRDREPHR